MAAGGLGVALEASRADRSGPARTLAEVAFVGGAALGLASLGTLVFWPRAKARAGSAALTPLVGDRAAGLNVCGVW
jgi:hypothetical protein